MDKHVIGQGGFSEKGDSASSTEGTSLSVQQFLEFARGTVAPHSPSQQWRVTMLITGTKYCMGCFDVRTFDVFVGVDRWFGICRCCGEEVRSG
jgi:hypothetical protein